MEKFEEYYIEHELIVKQKIEDNDDSSNEEYAPEDNGKHLKLCRASEQQTLAHI